MIENTPEFKKTIWQDPDGYEPDLPALIMDLRQELADVERASEAKSAFLAAISHEIRNPLGVIMGLAEIVLEDPYLSPKTRELLAGIQRNGRQLHCIVGKVLDLGKIEADAFELEILSTSFAEFLQDLRDDFQVASRAKPDVHFEVELGPGLPRTLNTDPTRLRQILCNLLGNALKFTERGMISLSLSAGEGRVELRVRDTGMGIAVHQHEGLFESYKQADPSIPRRFGGTGLGLAISRKIARALGGELKLSYSELGVGSEFLLVLPRG